jgi:non-specific serine/threonine protein kinase/serine/threonine-protein kinase
MTDRDRWHEIDRLFDEALDLAPEERQRFLETRCPPELRGEVERLLAGSSRVDEFLPSGEALRGDLARTLFDELERGEGAPGPGDLIDGFRLVRRVGEGGMGEVWEAQQESPVRRRVALKLVKLGIESKRVVARFDSERQALALMNHRNVAQVFGGGATGGGRPYFVMEFVPGTSVTQYCRDNGLSVDSRLDLFLQICEGVQHAHHKGVVHRDLKPSNILVTEEEGGPVPKIIDFGVARALDTRLSAGTALTEHGQIVGTPEYMSPEQADPTAQDIDTRADVYALGVLLYELLAGVRPFDAEDLRALGFLELLRRIRETDPQRPSLRAEPTQSRRLRGDLDWIVMKALEKDRARRYVSPHEMAEDVRRHLQNEPVLAGPPSRAYRLGKLVRRHRTTVAALAAGVLALVAGAAIAVHQAIRATRAEKAALADAETARQVSDFVVSLFEVSDPNVGKGATITARELLDRGASRMQGPLAGQPLVRARLETLTGDIYRKLGLFESARPLLEEALAARESALGTNDPETILTLRALGRLHTDRGENAKAEETLREALARSEAAARRDPAEEARVRCEIGDVLRTVARYREAEEQFRLCVAGLTRARGPKHKDVGSAWASLAGGLSLAGKLAESETAFRTGLATLEAALGPDDPEVAVTLNNLSVTLVRAGRLDEARDCLVRAIAISEKIYGPHHPAVASKLAALGGIYGRQGRLDESLALLERALAIRERVYGPEHAMSAAVAKNVGLTLVLMGEYEKARLSLERTLAIERKTLGPDHPQTAWTERRLGSLYMRRGDLAAAEASYRRALASTEKTVGLEHIEAVDGLRGLAKVAVERGRLEEADELLARAMAVAEKASATNPEISTVAKTLGELRLRQRRFADSEQALERARSMFPPTHPAQVETLVLLGDVQAAQARLAEAEALYRQGLAVAEKAHGGSHPDVALALHGLGTTLSRRGEAEEAAGCLARALAIRRQVLGGQNPDTRKTARAYAALAPAR